MEKQDCMDKATLAHKAFTRAKHQFLQVFFLLIKSLHVHLLPCERSLFYWFFFHLLVLSSNIALQVLRRALLTA